MFGHFSTFNLEKIRQQIVGLLPVFVCQNININHFGCHKNN